LLKANSKLMKNRKDVLVALVAANSSIPSLAANKPVAPTHDKNMTVCKFASKRPTRNRWPSCVKATIVLREIVHFRLIRPTSPHTAYGQGASSEADLSSLNLTPSRVRL